MVLGSGPPAAGGTRLLPAHGSTARSAATGTAPALGGTEQAPQGLHSAGEFTVPNKTLRPNILINTMKNLIVEKYFLHRLQKAAQEHRGNC